MPCFVSSSAIVRALFLFRHRERISFRNGFLPIFPFFNYSVKKGAFERDRESAVGF